MDTIHTCINDEKQKNNCGQLFFLLSLKIKFPTRERLRKNLSVKNCASEEILPLLPLLCYVTQNSLTWHGFSPFPSETRPGYPTH